MSREEMLDEGRALAEKCHTPPPFKTGEFLGPAEWAWLAWANKFAAQEMEEQ